MSLKGSSARTLAIVFAVAGAVLFVLITQRGNWSHLGITVDHPILMAMTGGLATFCLALATSYGIEIYFIGYKRSSLRMLLTWDKQIRYDLFFALLPWTPIYATLWLWMTFGLSSIDWPWMPHVKNTIPVSGLVVFPLQLLAIELTTTFCQYWQHRLFHIVPLLWETHKLHHSAERMTVLSFMRETPFTVTLAGALTSVPGAIIGIYVFPAAPTTVDYIVFGFYTVFLAANTLNQFVIHSNAPLTYGWVGRWFIVSPANHRVHHSILTEHHNKNFSVSWVVWDRLFGTYHEGADPASQNCQIGYEGNIYNKNKWIVIEYLYPTFAFLGAIYAEVARGALRLHGWLRRANQSAKL